MLSKAILGSLESQVNGLKDVENQIWERNDTRRPLGRSLTLESRLPRALKPISQPESLGYLNFNEMADFVNHTADCGGVVMNHRVIQPAET